MCEHVCMEMSRGRERALVESRSPSPCSPPPHTEHTEAARHYSMQLILDNINDKWGRLGDVEKGEVKAMCLQALLAWPVGHDPQYLKKKLATIVAEVAKRVWPQKYVG